MSSAAAIRVLQRNFLFRDLPLTSVENIATLATKRSYPKNTLVFSQGDEDDALYGVVSGRVRISASAPDGREAILNIMDAGDTFGEIALLDDQPRTASATTMDASDLIIIQRGQFLRMLEENATPAVHLLRLIAGRLRFTSELVEDSAFLSVPERLAKRLLSLSHLHGEKTAHGTEIKISQEDLGQFLGATRQVVNQHLQEWRKAGWIELGRGRIVLIDAEALGACRS